MKTVKSDPAVFTAPLSPDFPSLWDRWSKVITLVWRVAFGMRLDDWQVELLRHVLELCPPGHPRAGQLRYRQVIISLARQNGKTELAAILGLIGLLRKANSLVIGIASSAEQARIVYKRTQRAIYGTVLRKQFQRLTDTRGIEGTNGTIYELKAAKGAALQGLPVDTGVVDEVHLLKTELWVALVNGLGARPNGIVVGITTAGDEESELLKSLYENAQNAAQGDPQLESFGAFIFEAPEARVPDDDAELLQYLRAANPALASGRIDPELLLADVRAMPKPDILRYRLNRFVESVNAFLPLSLWGSAQRSLDDTFPKDARPIFTIDVTPDERYASITVTAKRGDIFYTELVASIVNPRLSQLEDIATRLNKHNPRAFVMDNFGLLKALGASLKKKGYKMMLLNQSDQMASSARFYALMSQKKVKHAGDILLTVQMPGTKRKNIGERFRVINSGAGQIDAVIATMEGIYAAETLPEPTGLQVF
ncbi:terminase large subunit [Microbacterium sp. cx-55]|uniref:terminase large subunit domain-containing protein n=1 Tax=Microbacterium sp. cx-55 TaxID=2875948 RepID=UPI001CBFDFFE|nr:terminase large subunit [Microbacterium sp. cx-55]MBZ4485995.1 hypothetical protein [Microbacterium sp. cx-55]UGB34131.1 terminase large subunit [Microbacterium sp. cx-55]